MYLSIAVILTGSMLKLKLADIVSGDQLYVFRSRGIFLDENIIHSGLVLVAFIMLIIILHLIIILSYKKRIRQIRMTVFTIVLLIGLTGLFFYFAYGGLTNPHPAFKISIAFPLISAVLDYLAIRAIGKDEALIRSVDRIRSKKK